MISENIYQMKANGTISYNATAANLNTFDLFLHNVGANFIIIAGGLLFSVISVFGLIFNAASIGAPFGADFNYFAVTILPHGVFEYTSTIIAAACAFNITKLEIRMIKERSFKSVLNESKRELKDILIMIVIVVVLLAVAAVIECNLIEPIMKLYFGI